MAAGRNFGQLLQEVEIADDDRQQIVEVMGDAAGQLADGLELLRLAQLFLELHPLSDVAADRHDRGPAFDTRLAMP